MDRRTLLGSLAALITSPLAKDWLDGSAGPGDLEIGERLVSLLQESRTSFAFRAGMERLLAGGPGPNAIWKLHLEDETSDAERYQNDLDARASRMLRCHEIARAEVLDVTTSRGRLEADDVTFQALPPNLIAVGCILSVDDRPVVRVASGGFPFVTAGGDVTIAWDKERGIVTLA